MLGLVFVGGGGSLSGWFSRMVVSDNHITYTCVCCRYTQWWDLCAVRYLPYSCDDGEILFLFHTMDHFIFHLNQSFKLKFLIEIGLKLN